MSPSICGVTLDGGGDAENAPPVLCQWSTHFRAMIPMETKACESPTGMPSFPRALPALDGRLAPGRQIWESREPGGGRGGGHRTCSLARRAPIAAATGSASPGPGHLAMRSVGVRTRGAPGITLKHPRNVPDKGFGGTQARPHPAVGRLIQAGLERAPI
jgi:hypothetical protein